ncbi:MAG: hypothetical protein RR840_03045 [Clostridium sp.]
MNKKTLLMGIVKTLYILFLLYIVYKSPAFFLFIGLHELAHLGAGKYLGYKFKKITMLPFGFSLCFKDDYIKPCHNIIISIIGPLTNLIFFGFFYCLYLYLNLDYIYGFAIMNLALCIFNLLPIGFFDGGRILKSLMGMYISIFTSNLIINLNGIIFGCIMIVVSLMFLRGIGCFLLILISISIIITSCNEIKLLKMNIIKDALYKKFQDNSQSRIVRSKYYSDNMRIFNILKRFSFNVSYNIISESEETLTDREIISYYFTKGNITLKECFIEHRRNIDVEYKRRDSFKC